MRYDKTNRTNVLPTPPTPTVSTVGPCSTIIQISRTPRNFKLLSIIVWPGLPTLEFCVTFVFVSDICDILCWNLLIFDQAYF